MVKDFALLDLLEWCATSLLVLCLCMFNAEVPLMPTLMQHGPLFKICELVLLFCFWLAPPLLFSATSPLGSSSAMAGERLLLQPTSAASTVASIISLSHTHQVISLKLTNTNYLY